MADTSAGLDGNNSLMLKYKDQGDGTFAPLVALTAADPVQLTGDVVVDTLGALNDAKVVNPDAASATLPALGRGQLKQLVDILAKETLTAAALGTPADAAWDGVTATATVISLLKKIALNTV